MVGIRVRRRVALSAEVGPWRERRHLRLHGWRPAHAGVVGVLAAVAVAAMPGLLRQWRRVRTRRTATQWQAAPLPAVLRHRSRRLAVARMLRADAAVIRCALDVAAPSVPCWSPNGAFVAYAVARADFDANAARSEIWILEWPSGCHHCVANDIPSEAVVLAWAPDSTRLAMLALRADTPELAVLDTVSGARNPLLASTKSHGPIALDTFYRTLAWSPDGTRLLYAAQDLVPDEPPDPIVDPRNDGDTYGEIERLRLWIVPESGRASCRERV